MNQLTQEQIKTLEDVFASYPEDYERTPKFTSMEGIQGQLILKQVDKCGNPYVCYISNVHKRDENDKGPYSFSMNKLIIG